MVKGPGEVLDMIEKLSANVGDYLLADAIREKLLPVSSEPCQDGDEKDGESDTGEKGFSASPEQGDVLQESCLGLRDENDIEDQLNGPGPEQCHRRRRQRADPREEKSSLVRAQLRPEVAEDPPDCPGLDLSESWI